MELTLFLLEKNIVSHMTRDELKYLDNNAILFLFFTKQLKKQTPWTESANELYRQSDARISSAF
jgi:hypothetical protein